MKLHVGDSLGWFLAWAVFPLLLTVAAAQEANRPIQFAPTPDELRQSYERSGQRNSRGRTYKSQITPHWFGENKWFWYRNELARGTSEFIRVNALQGVREPAFDHAQLAAALTKAGINDVAPNRLPIEGLVFHLPDNTLDFAAGGKSWRFNLTRGDLSNRTEPPTAGASRGPAGLRQTDARASIRNGPETSVAFANQTAGDIELFWLDGEGQRQSYGRVGTGQIRDQHTFAGHVWEIVDLAGKTLAVIEAEENAIRVDIDGRSIAGRTARDSVPTNRRRPGQRQSDFSRLRRGNSDTSADGKWTALVREGNVFVRRTSDGTETQLTKDGSATRSYGMIEWAPDSHALVAYRIEPGEEKEVFLVESSPREGGRAKLHQRAYPLPGDRFTSYELNLFQLVSPSVAEADAKKTDSTNGDPVSIKNEWNAVRPELELVDFGTPRPRWNRDGFTFTYTKTDRGHQRFRLIEVDSHSGKSRSIIDEKSDTFVWTAHTESIDVRTINWLEQTHEIVYASERDGWRHLYLIDAATGEVKNAITHGEWVVRGIDLIDEDRRQVWFRASGRSSDQDPYFIHYYRVNFDGTGLVALTEGNGNHTIQFSPDKEYLVDTYSRVDMPPVHELRRVVDGSLVCRLDEADISDLRQNGWQPPEVFVAKGRDGKTDIWGIICRPTHFDPKYRYPVIEDIYAGPHGSFVPKTFSPTNRFSSLTELGFVVVKIDGMGTANRSKAFHDVCWKNLKDAGFPDRILWHQAVAEKYAWYDTDRVGIYGTSAGGQCSTAALLFHSEFYKVAVSACGCHDNRMDKASWNEQWMGYPVGPQYSESSNIDNAHRLKGKLTLIVGEMDTNVPPESTYRLADALIRAGKDFDLVVVPGAGHGLGGRYGSRKLQDFFVRHLHGVTPPDHNGE